MLLVDRWRDLSMAWRAVALTGILSHELHDFRSAGSHASISVCGVVCGQRRRRDWLPHASSACVGRGSLKLTRVPSCVSDMSRALMAGCPWSLMCCGDRRLHVRIRHEMIDFITWRSRPCVPFRPNRCTAPRTAITSSSTLPMFAVVMAPLGAISQDTGKMIWFAMRPGSWRPCCAGLSPLFRAGACRAPTLVLIAMILMAKFYLHELLLGQTQPAARRAARRRAPRRSDAIGHSPPAALVGAAVFVKPYSLILMPWLLVTKGWRAAAMAASVVATGLLLPVIGLWLEWQPGLVARMAAHRHRLDDAEPSGERQRVRCLDVGEVAGPRSLAACLDVGDDGCDRSPGDRGAGVEGGQWRRPNTSSARC